ncbi:S9 family peptidase [Hyphococcus sp. DH-69]|uniref:S9 family peptidase n=1 Tax=Hyphococcus formosus TaxID=3143534 RepID=UPI00398A6298
MQFSKLRTWFVIFAFMISGAGGNAAASDPEPFTIDDYAKIRRVSELALSADGAWLAYAVEPPEQTMSVTGRQIVIQKAAANEKPLRVSVPQDARHLSWIADKHELAYISTVDGTPQVFKTNINARNSTRLTDGTQRVISYKFSNDGKKLAWISLSDRAKESRQPTLYEQLHSGEKGVVIDHLKTRLTHFVSPHFREAGKPSARSLWITRIGGKPSKANIPGVVTGFEWSSSGDKLSVRYLDDPNTDNPFASLYTSIGVFDIESRDFLAIGAANHGLENSQTVYYTGGEWTNDDQEIFVRRNRTSGFWRSQREWRRVSIEKALSSNDENGWHDVTFYPTSARISQFDEGDPFVSAISDAKRSIYSLNARKPIPEVGNIDGDIALPQFDANKTVLAFVNENIARAPEIFVRRNDEVVQITNLNNRINKKKMPIVTEVKWKGEDGALIQGWLLTPPSKNATKKPVPMLTFLHGGPSMPMTNAFAQYYTLYGGIWPYPLEVFPLNGIAVFIPNYRGTDSFGYNHANPEHSDVGAPEDVILGIQALIDADLADPHRLGIIGHSHGAWLGALVMTKFKKFVAASFGEGPQNNMLTYIFSPGYLYEQGYHKLWGAGLYQSPQRYLETSPVFFFDGLDTAALFEAGVESQAISMMGSPKAAHLAGMPTEFVVYPKIGHNVSEPTRKKEIAQRNLDWFLFWMLGIEGEGRAQHDQFERWREMRDESCRENKPGAAMITYCEF